MGSFEEQVHLFYHTDILVSPHGGQLTNVVFMPSCGAVLELFVADYFIPGYFGTLAFDAGLDATWLHVYGGVLNSSGRHPGGFCVPVNETATAVGSLADRWRTCVAMC